VGGSKDPSLATFVIQGGALEGVVRASAVGGVDQILELIERHPQSPRSVVQVAVALSTAAIVEPCGDHLPYFPARELWHRAGEVVPVVVEVEVAFPRLRPACW